MRRRVPADYVQLLRLNPVGQRTGCWPQNVVGVDGGLPTDPRPATDGDKLPRAWRREIVELEEDRLGKSGLRLDTFTHGDTAGQFD